MTSNHFFRQSLFHFEEEIQQEDTHSKNVLTPWNAHEEIPRELSKKSKPIVEKSKPIVEISEQKEQKQVKEPVKLFQSNLLPQRKPRRKDPSLFQELPAVKSNHKKFQSIPKERGMPIQQFLSQKREQKQLQQALYRRSIALIDDSLEGSFLAKRSLRKKCLYEYGYSKTIEIQRTSNPMHVYRSQQVVDISPQKYISPRKELTNILHRYLPIKSDRYH